MVLSPPLWKKVHDPRDRDSITYSLASLAFAGILMFLCRLGARRQIGLLLRNGPSVSKVEVLFGVESFPHGDTLGYLFRRLDPNSVQEVVTGMTERLIRKKVLYPYRLLGRYFVVAVDGTGILTYSRRHCRHCLTQTQDGKTIYYHKVLEAKLVTPNGFAFSLMSEFIENAEEEMTQQDCELRAFYRLAKRLRERFPRLPIMLSLDGLYAGGPTFELCREFGWRFMIVLKDRDLRSVNEEFGALAKLQRENRLTWHAGNKEVRQSFRWVTDIGYIDSDKREHTLSVLECRETKKDRSGQDKTTKFKWVTNLKLTQNKVIEIAHHGGRIRWKIENEGFNVQKRGGYRLEHAYSDDPTAAKIFYFLLQIAHLLHQLMEKGSLLRKAFPGKCGSAQNLAFRLLEAWRNAYYSKKDLDALLQRRFQIRFDDTS